MRGVEVHRQLMEEEEKYPLGIPGLVLDTYIMFLLFDGCDPGAVSRSSRRNLSTPPSIDVPYTARGQTADFPAPGTERKHPR